MYVYTPGSKLLVVGAFAVLGNGHLASNTADVDLLPPRRVDLAIQVVSVVVVHLQTCAERVQRKIRKGAYAWVTVVISRAGLQGCRQSA